MRDPSDLADLDTLKAALCDNIEPLAEELLGTPTKRTSREWRWGQKYSTRIIVAGERRGRFSSFEAGKYGGPLDLIMFAHTCSLVEAIDRAKRWLGDDATARPTVPKRPVVADIDDDAERRKEMARQIWRDAGTIRNTPGERYLRGRAIDATTWPGAVRWSSRERAVIFASTDAAGDLNAVQRVYVNADGTPKLVSDGKKLRKLKITRGVMPGTAVRFAGIDGPLLLAEGPETALSVWFATGWETWSNLGSIANAPLGKVPLDRIVVVCADDDPRNATGNKALRDAVGRWRAEGRTVLKVKPWRLTKGDKSDFNDALTELGREAVRERIEAVLKPATPIRRLPRLEAIKLLATTTAKAFEDLLAWNGEGAAPMIGLKVGTGLGKTEEALRQVVELVRQGKGSVAYLAPTHHLNAELLQRVEAIAAEKGVPLRAAIRRGREADNPDRPGEKMCRDVAGVRAVMAVNADPETTICRVCPYRESCAYRAQDRQDQADVTFAANASLFHEKPAALGDIKMLVIDEAFWGHGKVGLDGQPIDLALDELDRVPSLKSAAATADIEAELMPLRRKAVEAMTGHGDGPLLRQRFIDAGMTAEDAARASKLEWRAKAELKVTGATTPKGLRDQIAAAQGNRAISRLAMFWKAVEAMLADAGADKSGRAELTHGDGDDGRHKVIRLRGRKEIGTGWRVPTLHLDATMRLDLVRPFYPQAELRADIEAETPHQRIVQVYDKTFAKGELANTPKRADDAWFFAVNRAQRVGGKGLVVAQKDVEDDIRDRHQIPDFIDTAHHNAIAGRDEWKKVRSLVVIGRTQPKPVEVERIAGALTGRAVEPVAVDPVKGWYPAATVVLRSRQGQTVTVEADRHPDPLAESVRAAICDDELVQIIGRARGGNRTAADPVEVVVMGNIPLPVEVDAIEAWAPPSLDDRMLAQGAWLESAPDAAVTYPELGTAESIKKVRQRTGTFPYKSLLYENVPHLRTASYRRAGPGRSLQRIVYDPRLVPDPKAWLETKLGPLAVFELADQAGDDQVQQVDHVVEVGDDLVLQVQVDPVLGDAEADKASEALQPAAVDRPLAWSTGGKLPDELQPVVRSEIASIGLTQTSLAKLVGVKQSHISNWLRGHDPLSAEKAAKLCAFLATKPRRQLGLAI